MATVARLFIAFTAGPVMGGFVGQSLGRAAGDTAKASPGVLARWEIIGVIAGLAVGLIFASLLAYCVMGWQGRLRRRVADPVLLALGLVGVTDLLARRANLPPAAARMETAITILVWCLGLVFILLAIRYRPRAAGRARPTVGEDYDDAR